MKLYQLLVLLSSSLQGGQSIDLNAGTGTNTSPTRASTVEYTVEFQLDSITLPASQKQISYDSGRGVQILLTTTAVQVVNTTGEAPSAACSRTVSNGANLLVRVQRKYTALQFVCDFWNVDGSNYERDIIPIGTPAAATLSTFDMGCSGCTARMAFYRTVNSLAPDESFPPTTYSTVSWYDHWKFDNALTTTTGTGHTWTWSGATYYTTPSQVASSLFKVYGVPTWTTWVTMRAGHSNQLDGAGSFSMADSDNTVGYFWQQTAGPTTVRWSSRTVSQPAVTGLIFGTYTFQLTVTDVNGSTATSTLQVGAVSYDSNGVVIFPDSRLDKLFGPTIAFGRSTWEFMDESAQRVADYHLATMGYNGGSLTQEWLTPLAGTIAFSNGSTTVTGTGTDFQNDFCAGGTTPESGVSGMVIWWDVTTASGDYPPSSKIAPGNIARAWAYIASCDSATQITLSTPWIYSTGSQSGKQYSRWCCGFWFSTGDGATYYDGALAFYAMYYRSGNTKYRDAARFMTDGWLRHPMIGFGANVSVLPRVVAASSLFLRYGYDNEGDTSNYQYVQQIARLAGDSAPGSGVLISDPREDSYSLSWWALRSIFDSDNSDAVAWLSDAYTNRWSPQQQGGGNYLSNYFENNNGGSYVTTNGSATVTGSGISTICGPAVVTATGTLSATNASTSITGSGTSFTGTANKIMEIHGTRSGSYYIFLSPITSAGSSTSITLTYPYDGDTASGLSFRITDTDPNGFYSVWFATTASPPVQDAKHYTCTYVSATEITLDRPYEGTTGAKYAARANLAGRGSQPFMMGISAMALRWAAQGIADANPTLAANYRALGSNVMDWLFDTGYNATTGGLWYGRVFPNCEPPQNFVCDLSTREDRDLSAETNSALSTWYEASPTTLNRDAGDVYYGKQWGKPGYSSVYSDGQYNQYDDITLYNRGKYNGFAFGVGMAHQWPAVRVGGVTPADLKTYTFGFTLPAGSDRVSLEVLRPSGEVVIPATCTTSPCTFPLDTRQGTHWVRHSYQTSGGAVRAVSEWSRL